MLMAVCSIVIVLAERDKSVFKKVLSLRLVLGIQLE